jgi:hypothetical protein
LPSYSVASLMARAAWIGILVLTTFVGDSQVEAVVTDELNRLNPTDLGPLGQVVLSTFRAQTIKSQLLRLPSEDLCYAFNLIRFPTTKSTVKIARLIDDNRAAYERIRDAGARYILLVRSRCRRTTGSTISDRYSAGCVRRSASSIPITC